MLQGIAVTATTIFQIVPFLVFNVLSPFLDTTPRKKFERWITLSSLSWGDTYPKFTLFAIIGMYLIRAWMSIEQSLSTNLAIAYSCVAPLVLGFATLGLFFLYLAFRYNVFYVLTMAVDTKGDAYARAMQHLSVGVYIAELCLIGLLAAESASGPTQLMVLLLVLTIIYQMYLNVVLAPLTNSLSDKLMAEDEEEALAEAATDGESPVDESATNVGPKHPNSSTGNKVLDSILEHGKRGGAFAPLLFHGTRSEYSELRKRLWEAFPGKPVPHLSEDMVKHIYHHPAVTAKPPRLWIARDELGVSKQEVKDTGSVIDITDEGANFNEKGKIDWSQESPKDAPVWTDRVEF